MKAKSRDGPSFANRMSLRDIHALIESETRVYFRKGGRIGAKQIEKGYPSGVMISVSHDGDKKKLIFEMAVGPKYELIYVPFCGEKDIDLPLALNDLKKNQERQESGHQA